MLAAERAWQVGVAWGPQGLGWLPEASCPQHVLTPVHAQSRLETPRVLAVPGAG